MNVGRIAIGVAGFVLVGTGFVYVVQSADLLEFLGALLACGCGSIMISRAIRNGNDRSQNGKWEGWPR